MTLEDWEQVSGAILLIVPPLAAAGAIVLGVLVLVRLGVALFWYIAGYRSGGGL